MLTSLRELKLNSANLQAYIPERFQINSTFIDVINYSLLLPPDSLPSTLIINYGVTQEDVLMDLPQRKTKIKPKTAKKSFSC
ncbi:CLUMA_CG009528, isoform A [Clunio marinus]|uniref:CLUMA_CG009528, isoform A n=1 Tax=Clunio marinus TaxID=568069 RepID=A0A1J1I956_9DIPT|nr:CLUMA_CG009528, isoform A [Clunio marinus]